jgi:hypothetical protein
VNAKELISQQKAQALEDLALIMVALARLRKLIREQESYEGAAFEESVKVLMGKFSHTARKFVAHISILVALRGGRVKGVQYDDATGGENCQ